jgi:predicted Fe-Mo cluster-binding NifX family protein
VSEKVKVALTVWEGRISPVFDVSRQLRVYDIQHAQVMAEQRELFADELAASRIEQLIRLGVSVLVCGAISESQQAALRHQGIEVIGFIAGDADKVISAYLRGGLPEAMLMPGCRKTQRKCPPRWQWRRSRMERKRAN